MLTKEEIEAQRELWNKGPNHFPESRAWKNELCDLALVGLSVQEGAKDAREVVRQIRTLEWDDSKSRKQEMSDDKAAQLIAAFALKQKGEVVLEFDTTVEYQPVGMSKIILPWENGEDEELRYKTVHVTITAPKPLEETR